jgi:hypothetical protein
MGFPFYVEFHFRLLMAKMARWSVHMAMHANGRLADRIRVKEEIIVNGRNWYELMQELEIPRFAEWYEPVKGESVFGRGLLAEHHDLWGKVVRGARGTDPEKGNAIIYTTEAQEALDALQGAWVERAAAYWVGAARELAPYTAEDITAAWASHLSALADALRELLIAPRTEAFRQAARSAVGRSVYVGAILDAVTYLPVPHP